MAKSSRVDVATVGLWGCDVGAVAWDSERGIGNFEFAPSFIRKGIEIAPLTLPLRLGIHSFASLNRDTFYGLPGLLADALPDRFGNRLMDVWLAQQGRMANDFSPVERLCYMGIRGMGALEFKPAIGPKAIQSIPLEVPELSKLIAQILKHRTEWSANLKGSQAEALSTIIRVGTSAGGNRPKAVIAWNPKTHEVRSGQVAPPPEFESWLLKFDGVAEQVLGDPKGFGLVEFVYHKMALEAGISMNPCHLLQEGGRSHFMTRRFDRASDGTKIHMQSLCAMAHFDFNAAGEYSYEQAMGVILQLNLGHPALKELYRRMVFNVVARNQDDHTRNISFLMNPQGKWSLAPAYDVTWAYNSKGTWTNRHQMTINSKREDFTEADLLAVAKAFHIKSARDILDQVKHAVSRWPRVAKNFGIRANLVKTIGATHRLKWKK